MGQIVQWLNIAQICSFLGISTKIIFLGLILKQALALRDSLLDDLSKNLSNSFPLKSNFHSGQWELIEKADTLKLPYLHSNPIENTWVCHRVMAQVSRALNSLFWAHTF